MPLKRKKRRSGMMPLNADEDNEDFPLADEEEAAPDGK
jgi:hypothetical protein